MPYWRLLDNLRVLDWFTLRNKGGSAKITKYHFAIAAEIPPSPAEDKIRRNHMIFMTLETMLHQRPIIINEIYEKYYLF
jgi:hypothetical protein